MIPVAVLFILKNLYSDFLGAMMRKELELVALEVPFSKTLIVRSAHFIHENGNCVSEWPLVQARCSKLLERQTHD